jgi:hypothetical protein
VTLAIAAPPSSPAREVDQAKDRVRIPDPRAREGTCSGTADGAGILGPGRDCHLKVLAKPAGGPEPAQHRITAAPPPATTSRVARFTFKSTERGSAPIESPTGRSLVELLAEAVQPGEAGRPFVQVRAVDSAQCHRSPAKHV